MLQLLIYCSDFGSNSQLNRPQLFQYLFPTTKAAVYCDSNCCPFKSNITFFAIFHFCKCCVSLPFVAASFSALAKNESKCLNFSSVERDDMRPIGLMCMVRDTVRRSGQIFSWDSKNHFALHPYNGLHDYRTALRRLLGQTVTSKS